MLTSGLSVPPGRLPDDGADPVLMGASAFTNDPIVEDAWAGLESDPLTGASTLTSDDPFVEVEVLPVAGADPDEDDELMPGAVPVLMGASAFTSDPVVEDDWAGVDESGPLTGASALINGEGNANGFDAGGTGEVPVPGSDPVPGRLGAAGSDPVPGRLGADGSVPDPGDVADGTVPVFTGACAFTNDPVVEDDWAAGAPGPLTGASNSTSGELNGKGTDGVVGLVGLVGLVVRVVPVGGVVPLGVWCRYPASCRTPGAPPVSPGWSHRCSTLCRPRRSKIRGPTLAPRHCWWRSCRWVHRSGWEGP